MFKLTRELLYETPLATLMWPIGVSDESEISKFEIKQSG